MPTAEHIKRSLERADTLVTLAPERGCQTYANTARIDEGTLCVVEDKSHRFTIDAGRGMGGEDNDPTPSALLRSALTGCVAIGVKLWAARRDLPIDRVEVALETDSDARGILGLCVSTPPGFTGWRMRVDVQSSADRAAIEDVIGTSLRFSPLIDALANAQRIETDIHVTQPTVGG